MMLRSIKAAINESDEATKNIDVFRFGANRLPSRASFPFQTG
jgi:hypothetical protein